MLGALQWTGSSEHLLKQEAERRAVGSLRPLSNGQWRLSEALVVPGWVSPAGRVPLASGGVSLTVWTVWRLSSSWAEACNPGAGTYMENDLLCREVYWVPLGEYQPASGDKECYLSSPELRYLPAQETATSSKRAQWWGTGIGGLRPKFFRVDYSDGVPVESSKIQFLKGSVWSLGICLLEHAFLWKNAFIYSANIY